MGGKSATSSFTTATPDPDGLHLVARPRTRRLLETIDSLARDQHRIVIHAADFADSNEWTVDGYPTAAHWIAAAADIETSTAREWIRVGRSLRGVPKTAEAFGAKVVSYSKIRTLTRFATPDNEDELLALAQKSTAGDLGRAVATWLERNSTDDELEQHQADRRSCTWRLEPDGMTVFTIRLAPLAAGTVIAKLEATVRKSGSSSASKPESDRASLPQQQADALAALIGSSQPGSTSNHEVVLHVRGDGCTMDDGTPITESLVERIAPDAFIRVLIHDADGHPVNASGRRRHPSTRQKRVVKERHRACVDCGGSTLLEYDHVPAFKVSGRTVIDQLQLRCSMCHSRRHGES